MSAEHVYLIRCNGSVEGEECDAVAFTTAPRVDSARDDVAKAGWSHELVLPRDGTPSQRAVRSFDYCEACTALRASRKRGAA